jgi:hypothetical protein
MSTAALAGADLNINVTFMTILEAEGGLFFANGDVSCY